MGACVQEMPVSPSPAVLSGIEGHVTKGPMCPGPVPIDNTQCPDQPFQATISILDLNSNQIAQFQTDISGYFKLTLAPGEYILHPDSDKALPHATDQSIIVASGQFTQVTITYDTGIR
jgi:hypothetical protein